MPLSQKYGNITIFSLGVGTVSTAEFFRIPVTEFLRRRTIAGDLQSSPYGPYINGGRFRQEETENRQGGSHGWIGRGSRVVFFGRSIPERSRNGRWRSRKFLAKYGREKFRSDRVGPGNFFAATGTRRDYSGIHRYQPEKIRSDRIRRPGTFPGRRELICRIVLAKFLQRLVPFPAGGVRWGGAGLAVSGEPGTGWGEVRHHFHAPNLTPLTTGADCLCTYS